MLGEDKIKQQHSILWMKVAKHGYVRCTTESKCKKVTTDSSTSTNGNLDHVWATLIKTVTKILNCKTKQDYLKYDSLDTEKIVLITSCKNSMDSNL